LLRLNLAGALGWDLEVILGLEQSNTLGVAATTIVGQEIYTKMTPAGVVAAFGVPLPMVGAAGMLNTVAGVVGFPLLLASSDVIMGNSIDFKWGSCLEVGSGYRLELTNSAEAWKLTPGSGILALLYAGVAVADVVVPPLLPLDYKTVMGNVEGVAAAVGPMELILNIWSAFEGVHAGKETAEHTAEEAEKAAVIKTLQGDSSFAKTCISQMTDEIMQLGALAAGAEAGIQATASASTKMCDSLYTIDSPLIVLRSSPTVASQYDSRIKLAALGGLMGPGEVTVYASGKSHIAGGPEAYLDLETTAAAIGSITLDCGAAGTLNLQSGLTGQPNRISMEPDGIGITSSLKTFLEVLENSLTVTPAGISIEAGESIIELTPEGITLSVGPNVIEITPEGITITGLLLTLESEANIQCTAPTIDLV
jgi:hypothetical protein